MTKVSFYKLNNNLTPLCFVCSLVKKAHDANRQVLCQVPNQQVANSLDKLLWTNDIVSFLPHGIGSASMPIAISIDPLPGEHYQLLINLCNEIPEWFSRFERIIEIVGSDIKERNFKRANFQFYKDRGYPLAFFDLTKETKGDEPEI